MPLFIIPLRWISDPNDPEPIEVEAETIHEAIKIAERMVAKITHPSDPEEYVEIDFFSGFSTLQGKHRVPVAYPFEVILEARG